jgi:hypothetical protein
MVHNIPLAMKNCDETGRTHPEFQKCIAVRPRVTWKYMIRIRFQCVYDCAMFNRNVKR